MNKYKIPIVWHELHRLNIEVGKECEKLIQENAYYDTVLQGFMLQTTVSDFYIELQRTLLAYCTTQRKPKKTDKNRSGFIHVSLTLPQVYAVHKFLKKIAEEKSGYWFVASFEAMHEVLIQYPYFQLQLIQPPQNNG